MIDYVVNLVDELDHILAMLEGLNRRIGRDLGRVITDAPPGMRGSYGRLLNLIGPEGTRPTLLADGAAISKQAVGMRLREMIERGWVASEPDPTDGRATVVRLTAEGRRLRDQMLTGIEKVEREWAATVGPRRYATFRAVLDELAMPHLSAAVVAQKKPLRPRSEKS